VTIAIETIPERELDDPPDTDSEGDDSCDLIVELTRTNIADNTCDET